MRKKKKILKQARKWLVKEVLSGDTRRGLDFYHGIISYNVALGWGHYIKGYQTRQLDFDKLKAAGRI